jgi:hypothetical protein
MPLLQLEQDAHGDDRLSLIFRHAARSDVGFSEQTTGTLLKENGYYLGAPSFVDRILGFEHPEPRGHQLQIGIGENAAALLDSSPGPFQQNSKLGIHAKSYYNSGGGQVFARAPYARAWTASGISRSPNTTLLMARGALQGSRR